MKSDVTFNKVKLTNNNMDQNRHVSTQRKVRLRGRYDSHSCFKCVGCMGEGSWKRSYEGSCRFSPFSQPQLKAAAGRRTARVIQAIQARFNLNTLLLSFPVVFCGCVLRYVKCKSYMCSLSVALQINKLCRKPSFFIASGGRKLLLFTEHSFINSECLSRQFSPGFHR